MPKKLRSDQKAELLELFKEPRTVQEAADMVGCNYYTMWRKLKILRDEGSIRELPWPRDGHKVFAIGGKIKTDGLATVVSPNTGANLTLNDLRNYFSTTLPALSNQLCGAMSHMYMRAYGKASGESHLRGSVTYQQTRSSIRVGRDTLSALSAMLEQVLLLNVWEEDNEELINVWEPVENLGPWLDKAVEYGEDYYQRHGKVQSDS